MPSNAVIHYCHYEALYDGDLDGNRTRTGHLPKGCSSAPWHKAGEKIEIDKLPNGRIELRAFTPTRTIDDFIGLLAGQTDVVLSLEEIKTAIEDGWAGVE